MTGQFKRNLPYAKQYQHSGQGGGVVRRTMVQLVERDADAHIVWVHGVADTIEGFMYLWARDNRNNGLPSPAIVEVAQRILDGAENEDAFVFFGMNEPLPRYSPGYYHSGFEIDGIAVYSVNPFDGEYLARMRGEEADSPAKVGIAKKLRDSE